MRKTSEHFQAYPSRKQAIVVIAALAPILILFLWALVINSVFPIGVRLLFAMMIGFFSLILIGPARSIFVEGPMLEISRDGFRWRAWSRDIIPWTAVTTWKVTSYLGIKYVTVWLKEPHRHRSTTMSRWAQYFNHWVGQGQISVPGGGLTTTFEEVAAAFRIYGPKQLLPDDPRLARRMRRARNRMRNE